MVALIRRLNVLGEVGEESDEGDDSNLAGISGVGERGDFILAPEPDTRRRRVSSEDFWTFSRLKLFKLVVEDLTDLSEEVCSFFVVDFSGEFFEEEST